MTVLDNIRRLRHEREQRAEPILDMNALAERIRRNDVPAPAPSPADYAPPAVRDGRLRELAVRTVESFGALPAGELDEIIRGAEEEVASLKREAQEIRDDYVRRTDALAAGIQRLTAGCLIAKETLCQLREQCAALDATEAPEPAAAPAIGGGEPPAGA